ncbi:Gfo/Idh/MocA family oxidoreductase [Clostridioides difficile]|nr:Gfo/Idh/MocA family oxidoreductase [Clostridioides difficile]
MNDKVKLKILVCGVGFGQFYLKALERLKDEYELVGIFSRGSEISKDMQKYKVPLLTDISSISKNDVDVACVVINSTLWRQGKSDS